MANSISICVAGGRDFNDIEYMFDCLDSVKHLYWRHEVTLISGAAKGADELGERYARDQHWLIESHSPQYTKFKGNERYAPLARNEEMAKEADVLVAFWDGKSKGTRHMIGCAFRQGLEIHIFRYNRGEDDQGSLDFLGAD